jgi:uncharacterized protein YjbI with pentapeptide repeats
VKIVKPLTLGILHKPFRHQGRYHLAVAALGFFRLGASSARFLTENLQWPKVVQALPPGRPLDEIMPKARPEFLLAGHAHAPGGKPVTEMRVRACIAGIDKSLRVIGAREWMFGMLPAYRVTSPQPFTSMPLVYERAFGGAGIDANPAGCGHARGPLPAIFGLNHGAMPNLEYPGSPVKAAWKRYQPACFGAIDAGWAPRKHRHGTYGKRWLEEDAPGLARDVDWRSFNMAPEDQWLPDQLQGGEAYLLEGLHPALPEIRGELPRMQARAFLVRQGRDAQSAEEVPLRMDTVWFLPDHELGVAIYHGQAPIDDSDALDVAALMIGYDDPAAPRALAHYRDVMALRLAPDTGALHAFNESQLAPAWPAAEQAQRATRQAAEHSAMQRRLQDMLDELDADFWQESGMQPPPGHCPATAPEAPLGALTQHAIEDGDFDLSDMVNKAAALSKQALADGLARLAEVQEQPRPRPEPQAQKAAALERASVPASDLLPDPPLADPQLAPLLELLDGLPVAQGGQAHARAALQAIPALRRKARNTAIRPSAPAETLLPEVASSLGQYALAAYLGGACMAGRDLAGADLRGADFCGADLREVMFEQADLRGAKFAGANLAGAVFTSARLDKADFSGALLAGANFCGSEGEHIVFAQADLSAVRALDAKWPGADLTGAILDDCIGLNIELSGACLDGVRAHRATLIGAKADASTWRGADLDKTVALGASLEHADFSGARLHKAVLMDARLHQSVWRSAALKAVYAGGKADWSGADLRGARADSCGWHGASLAGADLRDGAFLRCDFGECDMSRADLRGGLFSRSLFMRTRLSNARASQADFFQALCRKADFSCADLRGASLAQAEMSHALLTGACLDSDAPAALESVA